MNTQVTVKVKDVAAHLQGKEISSILVHFPTVLEEYTAVGLEYPGGYDPQKHPCVLCIREEHIDDLIGNYGYGGEDGKDSGLLEGLAHGFDFHTCRDDFTNYDSAASSIFYSMNLYYLLKNGSWIRRDENPEEFREYVARHVDGEGNHFDPDDLDDRDIPTGFTLQEVDLFTPIDFPDARRHRLSQEARYCQSLAHGLRDSRPGDEDESSQPPHMEVEIHLEGNTSIVIPLYSSVQAAELANVLAERWKMEIPEPTCDDPELSLPDLMYPGGNFSIWNS